MKSQKRPFQKDILNHCYVRTADGGLLFYTYSDYLEWFTTVCVATRKHHVQVLAMCAMPDHVHLSVVAKTAAQLSGFMRDWSRNYARSFNERCHRTGCLFDTPFGSVPKFSAKKARTNLIYVWNNPVERQLANKAEDYRWTFMAYAVSDHPFSQKLVVRDSRWPMQKAIKEVREWSKTGKPMIYNQLKRLFGQLTPEESHQLIDFIITSYNVIDYKAAIQYFNSYEDMLSAVHSTTGSEYDLNEVFIGKTDAYYSKMTSVIIREMKPGDIHDIIALPKDQKYEVFLLLRKHTFAMADQIAKYLHLKLTLGPINDAEIASNVSA